MDSFAGLTIAVYARYSSTNQRAASVEDQVRKCRELVAARGGLVADDMIFADRAVSGASVNREHFDRLYALLRKTPSPVHVVVTEATDRISRDLGDSDRFFKYLEFAGIRLVCVADGIDSLQPGARMMFGMRAVMADFFLEDLRQKTMRGLEGQALRGRSTGGLALGYASTPIWEAGKKEPVGHEIVIEHDHARLVVRIFEMYRSGQSPSAIAAALNAQGLEPPRQRRDRRPGWVASTIREILRNESYVGVWHYKRKHFRKAPGTNKRRAKRRPPEEVLVDHRPHLRIVPQQLWDDVAERRQSIAERHTGKRKDGMPGRRAAYPFSGLLFCAACGAPMVVLGGTSATYYRCSDALKRGTCANRLGVREDSIVNAAFAELKRVLVEGGLEALLRRKVEAKIAALAAAREMKVEPLDAELARVEKQIARFVDYIGETDPSGSPGALAPVRASLEKLAREQEALQRSRDALRAEVSTGTLPTPEEIIAGVHDIEACLRADPLAAREALRRLLHGQGIVMEPQPDGSYVGRSVVLPMRLAGRRKTRRLGASAVSVPPSGGSVSFFGCAGRI